MIFTMCILQPVLRTCQLQEALDLWSTSSPRLTVLLRSFSKITTFIIIKAATDIRVIRISVYECSIRICFLHLVDTILRMRKTRLTMWCEIMASWKRSSHVWEFFSEPVVVSDKGNDIIRVPCKLCDQPLADGNRTLNLLNHHRWSTRKSTNMVLTTP